MQQPFYDKDGLTLHCSDAIGTLRTLPSDSVDAIITDPPYGMDYQSGMRKVRLAKISNDKSPYIWWLADAFRVLKDGGAMYTFSDWRNAEAFRFAIELAGFTVRSQVVWDRMAHGMGDLAASVAPQHDIIWFATKGKFKFPAGRPKSVVRSQRVNGSALVHPNQKPIELMEMLIQSITFVGATIIDPFAGSGSTLVASRNLDRHCIGIEMSEDYCKVAVQRLEGTSIPDTPLFIQPETPDANNAPSLPAAV